MIKKILLIDEKTTSYFIVFSILSILFSIVVYLLSQSTMFGNHNKYTLIEMTQKIEQLEQKRDCDNEDGVKLTEVNVKGGCI